MNPEELEERLRILIQELNRVPDGWQENPPPSSAPEGEIYQPIQNAQRLTREIEQILQQIAEQTGCEQNRLKRSIANRKSERRVLICQTRNRFERCGGISLETQSDREIYEKLWKWCIENVDGLPVDWDTFCAWFRNKFENRCFIWREQQSKLEEIHQLLESSNRLWRPSEFNQVHYEIALQRRLRWFDDCLWRCPAHQSVVLFFNQKLEKSYHSVGIDEDLAEIILQAQDHITSCRTRIDQICKEIQETSADKTPEGMFKFLRGLEKKRSNLSPNVVPLVAEASFHHKSYSILFSKLWEEVDKSGKIWRARFPETLEEISKINFDFNEQLWWDSYVEALDKTWEWFRQNLEKYDSSRATFMVWFNFKLRMNHKREYEKMKNRPEVPVDPQGPSNNSNNQNSDEFEEDGSDESYVEFEDEDDSRRHSIFDGEFRGNSEPYDSDESYRQVWFSLKRWVDRDKTGELRTTNMQNPPQTAQRIIQEFLSVSNPREVLRDLLRPRPVLAQIAVELDIPADTLARFWQRSCAPAIRDFPINRGDLFQQ